MYAIDVCKTIDNFYERANTYKNAIENCNSLRRMTRILEGYRILVNEWVYVAGILLKIPEAQIKVLACNNKLYNIDMIAARKSQELFNELKD